MLFWNLASKARLGLWVAVSADAATCTAGKQIDPQQRPAAPTSVPAPWGAISTDIQHAGSLPGYC
jgi:hypothetical protein